MEREKHTREFTPENITSLKANEIFVFGSNLSGIHGKGAAKFALDNFGMRRGICNGLCGQSYAIPTRGKWIGGRAMFESLDLDSIGEYIAGFLEFARRHSAFKFYVTKIGCGYAGYRLEQIAKLFRDVPENVVLPREFCL